MPTYWSDTFTDTNGTELSAHPPDSGGTWAKHANNNCTAVIQSGELVTGTPSGGFGQFYVHSATPALDQQVTITGHYLSNDGSNIGVLLRSNYFIYYDLSNSSWTVLVIGQGVAGSALDAGRFTIGNSYDITFKVIGLGGGSGCTITIVVGSTQVYTQTITGGLSISTAGKTGVGYSGNTGLATGFHITAANAGDVLTPALGYTLTFPTLCGTHIPTPVMSGQRGTVLPPALVTLTPSGGVLATDFTATASDASGGTFGEIRIVAGQFSGTFTYTPASAGAKTITVTESSANGFGAHTAATTVTNDVLIIDGNSINDNVVQNVGYAPAVTLQTLLAPFWYVMTFAISGRTTPDLTAEFATKIQPTLNLVVGKKYLYVMEIGNDFSNHNPSPSAATVWSRLQSYITQAVGAGAKVLASTCLPRTTGAGTNWAPDQGSAEANRALWQSSVDTVNASLRAGWGAAGASAIVDPVADSRFQVPSNSTYFVDGTHLTSVGCAELAQQIPALLADLTGGPTGGGSGVAPFFPIGGGLVR